MYPRYEYAMQDIDMCNTCPLYLYTAPQCQEFTSPSLHLSCFFKHKEYRGTSLIRDRALLGACSRRMPRAPWWS